MIRKGNKHITHINQWLTEMIWQLARYSHLSLQLWVLSPKILVFIFSLHYSAITILCQSWLILIFSSYFLLPLLLVFWKCPEEFINLIDLLATTPPLIAITTYNSEPKEDFFKACTFDTIPNSRMNTTKRFFIMRLLRKPWVRTVLIYLLHN